MKVTIIGAGIGGLTTAVALNKEGIDYEIFESAPELKPVGAGIVMASNAMQVFNRLGIDKKIVAAGLEINNAFGVDQNFSVISGLSVKDKVATRYGIGNYAFHRARLQQVLLAELDHSKIHLNKKFCSLQQSSNGVKLEFEGKTIINSDLVIGADGIKSAVRKSIFGEIPFRYSGQTCWRGMTKFELPEKLKNNSYEMWGNQRGLRFGFVPTAKDEVYYFTTYYTDANQQDESGVKNKIRNIYRVFGEVPAQLIEATDEENIIRSDINDFRPMEKWWEGRVALVGDAAHATTPNLGQGGCQAVEDACVIAKALKEESTIEAAFAKYQKVRFEKAVHVVNMSWRFGRMTNIGNPILRSIRNSVMRMIPESVTIKQLDKILKLNY